MSTDCARASRHPAGFVAVLLQLRHHTATRDQSLVLVAFKGVAKICRLVLYTLQSMVLNAAQLLQHHLQRCLERGFLQGARIAFEHSACDYQALAQRVSVSSLAVPRPFPCCETDLGFFGALQVVVFWILFLVKESFGVFGNAPSAIIRSTFDQNAVACTKQRLAQLSVLAELE